MPDSTVLLRTTKTTHLATHLTPETHLERSSHALVESTSVPAHLLLTIEVTHSVLMVNVVVHASSHVVVAKVASMRLMTAVITMTTVLSSETIIHATEVHELILTMMTGSAASTIARVRLVESTDLFSLQLGLDSLAVRSVADHWQDGTNALNQSDSLSGVGIVESSLDDVVGERVSEELFQTESVEEFSDEDFAELRVGDSDALSEKRDVRKRTMSLLNQDAQLTFSITLELNFCTDKAQTFPMNCLINASLNRTSFKSKTY